MRTRALCTVLIPLALAASAMADVTPTTRPTTAPVARRSEPSDVPAIKLQKGQPDAGFLKLHARFLARGKSGPIGVLFLGDSITEFWYRAPDVYKAHYGADDPANFGISGDRTQHVLWRLDHGELDGLHPKVVVLMIGTNNIGDTAAHIAAADEKIVAEIHDKVPAAKLLLLGIFPRGADPAKPDVARTRDKIKQVNADLAKLDDGTRTRYLDLTDKFLAADGTLSKDVMPDALHPSPKGYQIWADGMQPLLDEMMKP